MGSGASRQAQEVQPHHWTSKRQLYLRTLFDFQKVSYLNPKLKYKFRISIYFIIYIDLLKRNLIPRKYFMKTSGLILTLHGIVYTKGLLIVKGVDHSKKSLSKFYLNTFY